MKAILLTIRLKYFYLTYKGIKTIEIRKSAPKDFVGDVYEVVSKTNFEKDLLEIPENEREFFRQFKGKVGLKFTLNKVEEIKCSAMFNVPTYNTETLFERQLCIKSCLGIYDIGDYLWHKKGYAWHISNLEIFDEPKELREFEKVGSYNNHTIKCKKKEQGRCNFGKSKFTGKWVGCEKARLTKAPHSYMFIEVGKI